MAISASEVISRLPACFDKARASQELLYFESEVHKHIEPSGLEYEIRLCPALLKKPKLPTPHFNANKDADGKKPDPFAPPYVPGLVVGEMKADDGEEFVVLQNKFCVVPMHFLLVTKDHQSQTQPLRPAELCQTYMLLDAARKAGKRFFAFYNCGDRSGASQHHKHLQFIPHEGDGPPIERVARKAKLEVPERPFSLPMLPYANHIRRLPASLGSMPVDEMEDTLAQAFLSLLDLAISTVRHDPSYPAGNPHYNVILTLEHMHLIPRREEEAVLRETGDPLSVNSLGFAGMLLVKSERELAAVKNQGIEELLASVALPSVHELQVEGTALEPEQLYSKT